MGFTEKELQREGGGGELEVKKWMIAGNGIPVRIPLKPIFTKAPPPQKQIEEEEKEEETSGSTPTSKESRIPSRLACPPPPPRKKPKTSSSSSSSSSCSTVGIRDQFFTLPDDFENLFTRTPCTNLLL